MVQRSGMDAGSVQDVSASEGVGPGRHCGRSLGGRGWGVDSSRHSPDACRAVSTLQVLSACSWLIVITTWGS